MEGGGEEALSGGGAHWLRFGRQSPAPMGGEGWWVCFGSVEVHVKSNC
jgi:hypothetical protein